MREFKDNAENTWKLAVSVGSVNRVREATGVLLTALFDDNCKLLGELSGDVVKLVAVLFCLCQKQAEAAGVTAEDFADALYGDALGAAGEALVRVTADFFTSPEQRSAIHAAIDKMEAIGKQVTAEATALVTSLDVSQLAKSYLDSVTNTPASSESTPETLPLANSA